MSHTTEDQVSSEWLIRGLDGKDYKPDDYLVAFSEYVKITSPMSRQLASFSNTRTTGIPTC